MSEMPHRGAEGAAGEGGPAAGDLRTYLRLAEVYRNADPDDKLHEHLGDALDLLWYRMSDDDRAKIDADATTERRTVSCPVCAGAGVVAVPAEVETVEAYYFGCDRESGHHWWSKDMGSVRHYEMAKVVGDEIFKRVDGGFCPERERVLAGRLHVLNGWTVVAFWDRSVDSRPGSNSVFVVRGERDAAYVMAMAESQFKRVMARLPGPVVVS